jgi:hypothetical protein
MNNPYALTCYIPIPIYVYVSTFICYNFIYKITTCCISFLPYLHAYNLLYKISSSMNFITPHALSRLHIYTSASLILVLEKYFNNSDYYCIIFIKIVWSWANLLCFTAFDCSSYHNSYYFLFTPSNKNILQLGISVNIRIAFFIISADYILVVYCTVQILVIII